MSNANRLSIKFVVYVYSILILLGIIICRFKFGNWDLGLINISMPVIAINIFSGLAVSIPIILFSNLSLNRLMWAREMENLFSQALSPLSTWKIFVIAAMSGIGEEVFFRGALQPILGLIITSLLFGIVHFPFKKSLIPWTIFAICMGFILGFLFIWSGNLISPIVAHATINFCNILTLNHRERLKRVGRIAD